MPSGVAAKPMQNRAEGGEAGLRGVHALAIGLKRYRLFREDEGPPEERRGGVDCQRCMGSRKRGMRW